LQSPVTRDIFYSNVAVGRTTHNSADIRRSFAWLKTSVVAAIYRSILTIHFLPALHQENDKALT
jgi:hypothetical protein